MKLEIKQMVLAALFGALTFLGYFVELPIGPVPITLQTLFVLLAGFLLEREAAFLAMVIHLLLKLLTMGAVAFMSPAFGFVVALPAGRAPSFGGWRRGGPITSAHTRRDFGQKA